MMGYYDWTWMWLFGGLIVIIVVGVIIYAVVRLTNASHKTDVNASSEARRESSSQALEILAQRYAKGEINDEEYNKIKMSLKNHSYISK
jgi:putative membrane protein